MRDVLIQKQTKENEKTGKTGEQMEGNAALNDKTWYAYGACVCGLRFGCGHRLACCCCATRARQAGRHASSPMLLWHGKGCLVTSWQLPQLWDVN